MACHHMSSHPIPSPADRSPSISLSICLIASDQMDSMFDEAVDISQAEVLRNLEYMWVKCVEQPSANQRGREHRGKPDDVGEFSLASRSRANSIDSMHSIDEGPSSHGRAKVSAPAPREYYVNALNPLHTQWTKVPPPPHTSYIHAYIHAYIHSTLTTDDAMRCMQLPLVQPYSQKTFRSQDIEIQAFVLVLIRRDLFMKRC